MAVEINKVSSRAGHEVESGADASVVVLLEGCFNTQVLRANVLRVDPLQHPRTSRRWKREKRRRGKRGEGEERGEDRIFTTDNCGPCLGFPKRL